MRKVLVFLLLAAGAAGYFVYQRTSGSAADRTAADAARGSVPRPGAGAFARAPMTVELATASRAALAEHIMVVGSLVGAATVEVVPKVSGRSQQSKIPRFRNRSNRPKPRSRWPRPRCGNAKPT
jgi:hypothetical protein